MNPEYSEVETLLYNPCAPGTRFGVTADKLPETLPGDIGDFIAIAIARVARMCLNVLWCISRRSSPNGFRRLNGLTLVAVT